MTKEEKREYYKEYYKRHREEKLNYQKKYSEENKDSISSYRKKYYKENKDDIASYKKKYYEEHKDDILHRNKQYRETKLGRACLISGCNNWNDRDSGFDTSNNVSADWIVDNVFSGQVCTYCGETDWTKLGVDRIDNSLPHIASNLVPCCQRCNCSRGNRRTVEEQIEYTKLKYGK